MSPRREVFEKPIVRVTMGKIQFPRICPVCGSRATKALRVTTMPGRKQYLRPSWDPMNIPSVRKRLDMTLGNPMALLVPVCEDHFYSSDDDCRYKLLCLISDGILMAMLAFALMIIGGDLWQGQASSFWVYAVVTLAVASFIITVVAFRPRPIEAAVRIVGFDPGLQNIWLDFANRSYQDAFLNENPIYSELVSWIIRT